MKFFALVLMLVSLPVIAEDQIKEQRKTIDPSEREFISNVLSRNDKLFNALLSENSLQVAQEAKELSTFIKESKSTKFKEIKLGAAKLNDIKATNKKEDNLVAYEGFSNSLIQVVRNYDVGSHYNIFSCPMVKKNWIQDVRVNKGVKNVFATYMLECGTQDTKF